VVEDRRLKVDKFFSIFYYLSSTPTLYALSSIVYPSIPILDALLSIVYYIAETDRRAKEISRGTQKTFQRDNLSRVLTIFVLYYIHMKIHHYTAIFQKELEGGYTVVIPALKGCVTYGETIEEAAGAAKEAIESYLGSLAKDHEPAPSDVSFVSTIDVTQSSSHSLSYA